MTESAVKLNVAIIDPVGKKAGMDHYDVLLLEGLQKAGAEVALFSNFTQSAIFPVQKKFHNINVPKFSAVLSNFTGFFRSLREARKNKTQWLILHVFRAGMFDLFSFSLARLMGFRICAIIHDIESLDTYTLPGVRRLVIRSLPHEKVVHNEFSKKELLRTLNDQGMKVSVIPHLNFVSLFTKNKSAGNINTLPAELTDLKKSNTPFFLFFGQIKNAKGIDLLLEAACQVKGDFKIVIAGKVREGNWNHYEQMIRALNLQGKIISVIRHISDDERDYLFAETRAVVLPYHRIYQSGVLLMAMSFPLPVIVSDLPPNREIVSDNVDGLLFKAGFSNDLALRMQEFLEGKYNSNILSSNALERMKLRYSPEKAGQLYFSLLSMKQ